MAKMQYQIRIDEDLRAAAEIAAQQDHRSLANYIIVLIEKDLQHRGIKIKQEKK